MVKQHVECSCHVENCLKVAFFGRTSIIEQHSKVYRDSVIQHNVEFDNTAIFCQELLTVLSSVVCLS